MVIGVVVVTVFVMIFIGIVVATILIFRRRNYKTTTQELENNIDSHDHLFDSGMRRSMLSRGMCSELHP